MNTLLTFCVAAGLFAGLLGVPSLAATSATTPTKAFASGPAVQSPSTAPADAPTQDARRADEVFAELQQEYRLLDGVTVRMGATPKQEQAVAYYTIDEIVISPAHEATIEEILAHEIWHIIDWRDNGRLDWGENLPPATSSDYLQIN